MSAAQRIGIVLQLTLCFVAALSLVGCQHAPEEKPPWNQPLAWSPESASTNWMGSDKPLPEFAEDTLSEKQKAELAKLRKTPVALVMQSSFEYDLAKVEIYQEWLFRGYTFTKATGMEFHHHSFYQNVTPERRPIIEGWLDGQLQAFTERILAVSAEMRLAISNSAAKPLVPK